MVAKDVVLPIRAWPSPFRVAALYWLSEDAPTRSQAWAHLASVLCLQYMKTKAATYVSTIVAKQLQALGAELGSTLRKTIASIVIAKVLLTLWMQVVQVLYERALRQLKVAWSRDIAEHLMRGYIINSASRLGSGSEGKAARENQLDQVVAEDVDKYVDLSADLTLEAAQAGMHLVLYTQVLYATSPKLALSTVVLAGLGTGIALMAGEPLHQKYLAERQAVGTYRYLLTRIRENAESIIFYGGEDRELRAAKTFRDVKDKRVTSRKLYRDIVGALSASFRKVAGLMPFVMFTSTALADTCDDVSHTPHLAESHGHSHSHGHGHGHGHGHSHGHGVSASVASSRSAVVASFLQATEAFDEILFHLMLLAENLNDVSRITTVADQVERAFDSVKDSFRAKDKEINVHVASQGPHDPWLALRDLTVLCQGEPLVQGLTLDLEKNCRLLITGESGVGKTTLLRAIQGLYKSGTGDIYRPDMSEVLFIPQQSYMTLGTLRDQVLYPLDAKEVGTSRDGELEDLLRLVGLENLIKRCEYGLDTQCQWSDVLSKGEQQRMAFARVAAMQPVRRVVFLDESTSSCDLVTERRLYSLLSAYCSQWISVGHRASIEKFHSQRLVLERGGSWRLENL